MIIRAYSIVFMSAFLTLTLGPHAALAATSSPAPAVDPCAVVAQADASQAVHGEAREATVHGTLAGKFCHYRSSDNKMNIFVQNVNPQIMKTLPALGAKAVPDVGDAAYLYRTSLYVQKGRNVVQINVYSNSLDGKVYTTELTTLGKLAASRM